MPGAQATTSGFFSEGAAGAGEAGAAGFAAAGAGAAGLAAGASAGRSRTKATNSFAYEINLSV